MATLGFFGVAAITQLKGLRIGGTVVIPTLAVYSLKEFVALPVFLVSTVVAYVILRSVKRRTLVYGRDEFVVALVVGSILPLAAYLGLRVLFPDQIQPNSVLFVGSILPGLAAFNVQQTKPEYRRQDLVYATGLFVGIVLLGALLVDPWVARRVGDLTPLVLFSRTSDIALLRDAVVTGRLAPQIGARMVVVALLGVGFVLAELVRRQFGIRIGIVSLALLALFGLTSRWLLVLFAFSLVAALAATWLVHHTTLLYGRVLISLACGIGVLVALALTLVLPIERGFSALFVGVLAGVDAYAAHATPPVERRQQFLLAVAVFAIMLVCVRLVITPFEAGVLQTFGVVEVGVAALVVVVCLLIARRWRTTSPSDEAVLSASVLSEGDGA
ncbi:poly-gamma-glutamate biosynthesis protein PgsC/CapC [Halorarius litoreus]|uniref:poly-gamma-glutamate biosynthesis protein PgsC/CapC n=1 Tax=Halorarius litoreus TaxID=2962676 RepID=UPI0020CF5D28|nr:poly-gamma-glutamate biosynthesis protein PgsC/CapC [Halorarius litoreus]